MPLAPGNNGSQFSRMWVDIVLMFSPNCISIEISFLWENRALLLLIFHLVPFLYLSSLGPEPWDDLGFLLLIEWYFNVCISSYVLLHELLWWLSISLQLLRLKCPLEELCNALDGLHVFNGTFWKRQGAVKTITTNTLGVLFPASYMWLVIYSASFDRKKKR